MNRASVVQKKLIGEAMLRLPGYLYRKTTASGAPRSVLVIPQLTRIGDLVCVTPAVRALKERFPGAQIDLLVTNKIGDILHGNPCIRRRVRYSTKEIEATLKELRAGSYDWCIDYTGSALGSAVAVLCSISHLVRLARPHEGTIERMLGAAADQVSRYTDHSYLPLFYCAMLAPLGVRAPAEIHKEVQIDPAERELVGRKLASAGYAGKQIVALSLSAGNSIKEWGDERFGELIRILSGQYDCAFAVIGSPSDHFRVRTFVQKMADENPELLITGVTDLPLRALGAFLQRCSLFIACDTGPIHVAEAVGTPVIDIVGPVHPSEQTPRGEMACIVTPDPPVEPSIFAFHPDGPVEETARALLRTSPERVLKCAAPLLSRVLTRVIR